MPPKKIFAPIASANTLFRIAVECDGYTPERAAADIAALIDRGCAVVPPLALLVRVLPNRSGGVIVTDADRVEHDGARVLLGYPGPQGVRIATVEDSRIDLIVALLQADPKLLRAEAWNALVRQHPSLEEREFDRYWAMAHARIGRDLPKAGRRKGKAKTARLDQEGNPIESRGQKGGKSRERFSREKK
jgi:hypothetical protein